jgi:hypothetical protein
MRLNGLIMLVFFQIFIQLVFTHGTRYNNCNFKGLDKVDHKVCICKVKWFHILFYSNI